MEMEEGGSSYYMNGNFVKVLLSIISGLLLLASTMAWRFYDTLDQRVTKLEAGQIEIKILLAGKGYSDARQEKDNLLNMLKRLNEKIEPTKVPE